MKIKEKKGISLIVLVVTIIVMIILATAIILSLSSTGIIGKANQAKRSSNTATLLEAANLAYADWELQHGLGKTTDEALVYVQASLRDSGFTAEEIAKVGILEGEITITGQITPANYGNIVKGYIDLDGNEETGDWQVFYNDGNNVWLIAKDYVTLDDATKAKTGMVTNTASGAKSHAIMWGERPDYGKKYINLDCVESLTDASNWTVYVDGEYADKAMGGPTLQMLVKSYNQKYPDQKIEYQYEIREESEGYTTRFVGETEYKTAMNPNAMFDNFYISYNSTAVEGYWLASPTPTSSEYVRRVARSTSDGTISLGSADYDNPEHPNMGLRPVVRLKSYVEFETTDEQNTLTIK